MKKEKGDHHSTSSLLHFKINFPKSTLKCSVGTIYLAQVAQLGGSRRRVDQ